VKFIFISEMSEFESRPSHHRFMRGFRGFIQLLQHAISVIGHYRFLSDHLQFTFHKHPSSRRCSEYAYQEPQNFSFCQHTCYYHHHHHHHHHVVIIIQFLCYERESNNS